MNANDMEWFLLKRSKGIKDHLRLVMVKPDSEDAATLFAIMFPPLDFQYNSITIEGIIRFYLCKINKGSKEVSTVREFMD